MRISFRVFPAFDEMTDIARYALLYKMHGMDMERELAEKYRGLKERVSGFAPAGIVVAFSGGVDSALLLKAACMAAEGKGKVYAVTVRTRLHPLGDLESARQTAAEFGAVHKVLELDELAETGMATNPVNRCYLCKKSIFQKVKKLAAELGVVHVLEGTNADDLKQYRPGIQALRELQIVSPLAEGGFTKANVRKLAEYLGIPAANRPSAPCLATRLPYGMKISYELLEKIDEGEEFLRTLGFYNVRLRVHELTDEVHAGLQEEARESQAAGGQEDSAAERKLLARIEVDRKDLAKLAESGEEVAEKLKKLGFQRVTGDLEGFRSGSMDEGREDHSDNEGT